MPSIVRFLTGRCIVSKARPNNKSDKVSPDLDTPTDLPQAAVDKISAALNTLLADAFALYLKTKNFHWHVVGPAFPRLPSDARRAVGRDLRHHRPAGRARAQARRHHAALDRPDRQTADHPGQRRGLCAAARDAARIDGRQQARGGGDAQSPQARDDNEDSGTAGLLETFIDETERRTWFLFEASRQEGSNAA